MTSTVNPANTADKPANTADKQTQCEAIKQHLQAGNTLTTFDAYRLFNITCLSQRIHDLRNRHGLIINSIPVIKDGKRFVIYTWDEANDNTPAYLNELTEANDTATADKPTEDK